MTGRKRKPAECGTYAGYQGHKRRGEKGCHACREANRTYIKAYRAKNHNVAAGRAQRELARRHPEEYRVLLAIEVRTVGLERAFADVLVDTWPYVYPEPGSTAEALERINPEQAS